MTTLLRVRQCFTTTPDRDYTYTNQTRHFYFISCLFLIPLRFLIGSESTKRRQKKNAMPAFGEETSPRLANLAVPRLSPLSRFTTVCLRQAQYHHRLMPMAKARQGHDNLVVGPAVFSFPLFFLSCRFDLHQHTDQGCTTQLRLSFASKSPSQILYLYRLLWGKLLWETDCCEPFIIVYSVFIFMDRRKQKGDLDGVYGSWLPLCVSASWPGFLSTTLGRQTDRLTSSRFNLDFLCHILRFSNLSLFSKTQWIP